jgi:uncharacterized membrane protein
MWADLINKDKVHRALWCALYMAVTLLLQNTVFAHIALFGVHAMFVPAVVVAVGVFEGGTWGAVFGLIIPIMNVLLSALLNGEPLFEWNYLAALVLVCIGIFLVNRAPQTQETKA